MGTAAVQDDPMLRLRYYRETGQTAEASNFEKYLRETGQFKAAAAAPAPHSRFTPAQLVGRANRQVANAQDEADVEADPSYAQQALGGIASLVRDVPGAEAAQAGLRSRVRGQSYRAALDDIRGAEDAAPAAARVGNRIVGGGVAAAVIPGSAPLAGARFGILHGLLEANPDADVKGRLRDAATGGALGAATGYAGQKVIEAVQAARALPVRRVADAVKAGVDAMRGEPLRLVRRGAPAPTATASPAVAPSTVTPQADAKAKLAQLLQKKLDESAEEMEIAANPPTNLDLMRRIEESLRTAKAAKIAKAARAPRAPRATAPTAAPATEAPVEAPAPAPPPAEPSLSIRDAAGRMRRDLSKVSLQELQQEYARLAELNAAEEAAHAGVDEAWYRHDYNELPRTERLGRRGQEDLPDADGAMDPDVLAEHNKIVRDYRRNAVVRVARAKALERIDRELARRPGATDFDFGANVKDAPHPPASIP